MSKNDPFFPSFMSCAVVAALFCGLCCTAFAEEQSNSVSSSEQFQRTLVNQYSRSGKTLTLPLPNGEEVTIDVSFYSFEDGYLSIGGSIKDNAESEFMMKIVDGSVYGWIHIFAEPMEEGTAYKYSASKSGDVTVSITPVTDIIKISDPVDLSSGRLINLNPRTIRAEELPDIVYLQPVADNVSINKLQSKPDADKVLWLDIRDIMDGETPKAYTREEMIEIWRVTAMGFSMYKVNVTTDIDVYTATPAQSRGVSLFHNRDGRSHCSYKGFGTTGDCEIYLTQDGFKAGRTNIHELGHLLGLDDQGTGLNGVQWLTYFPGYDEIKWVPIMGNFLYSDDWGEETLYQWSDGSYNAKNGSVGMPEEDVLEIMSGYIPIEEDDIPTSKALNINDGNLSIPDNYGMINVLIGGSDEDDFTFTVAGEKSSVDLHIDRIGHIAGSMLDVHAAILDASGNIIVEDNQFAARYANLKTDLDPGNYTLRIAGGTESFTSDQFKPGEFSKYGSIGYYGISGSISNAKVGVITDGTTAKSKVLNWKNNSFTFEGIPTTDNLTLKIYNVNGRVMMQQLINGTGTINLQETLGNGCYIFELQGKSHNHRERFIVSK